MSKYYPIFKTKIELLEHMVYPKDSVLDIGFWGQGTEQDHSKHLHALLRSKAKDVYGLDLEFDESALPVGASRNHYFKQNAETFSLPMRFSCIVAGDLIEHLSNPGLFLDSCKRHLASDGRLIITTPNAFCLDNIVSKMKRFEPMVNKDHTCYFDTRTLTQLFAKNGWRIDDMGFVVSLTHTYKESLKKRLLNGIVHLIALKTPKYHETFFVVARPKTE